MLEETAVLVLQQALNGELKNQQLTISAYSNCQEN